MCPIYAWARWSAREELFEAGIEAVNHLTEFNGWLERVGDCPAVKRGMEIPGDRQRVKGVVTIIF